MRCAFWLASLALAAVVGPAVRAQVDPELSRVRDLVRAGALPRRALVEAQNDVLKRGYRETLTDTLLKDSLRRDELEHMLTAASGLLRLAQDEFNLISARVEAGALPAKHLQVARDELELAERQAELAQKRADLIRQIERIAAAETYLEELQGEEMAYRFEGFNQYEMEALHDIADMYYQTFGHPPPVSADGDTDWHRSMGLDHTGRIDVALHPDSEEGAFLTYMLESLGIPYIAFRSAIPGQSTGPHIHVGPPSDRIEPGGYP